MLHARCVCVYGQPHPSDMIVLQCNTTHKPTARRKKERERGIQREEDQEEDRKGKGKER